MVEEVKHVGLNVYVWGGEAQDRLLVECLGPAACELRSSGLTSGFWFDRSDVRGPHIFGIFTTSAWAAPRVADHVSSRLDDYLSTRPSTRSLSRETLEARHLECRGVTLSAADADVGFADNNSYRLFEHEREGYPFSISAGLPAAEQLWGVARDLTLWSIEQLSRKRSTAAAVRCIAAFDESLRRASMNAEDCWRHHAASLIPALEERLAAGDAEILAALPAAVGQDNWRAFSRVWEEVERDPATWRPLERLLQLAVGGEAWPVDRTWALLREVKHVTLKQLGLPVALHLPLILFAWHRSRTRHAAQPRPRAPAS